MYRTFALLLLLPTVTQAQKLTVVAGGGGKTGDCPALEARLGTPVGIDFDQFGTLYIAEADGFRAVKVDGGGRLTVIAGVGEKGDLGDNGPALKARLAGLRDVAVASDGVVYLADAGAFKVRRVDLLGVVTAFAGSGAKGFGGDGGPARKADFAAPVGLCLDEPRKRLLITDADNRRLRVVDLATGVITTMAGTGQKGVPKDGAKAKDQPLVDPRGVTVDPKGVIYFTDTAGNAVRTIDAEGVIRTVINSTGDPGSSGDDGPALRAKLNRPRGLCLDTLGDLYIADTENNVIRRYRPRQGTISRFAGGGKSEAEQFKQPAGVRFGPSGRLHVADSGRGRVVRVD